MKKLLLILLLFVSPVFGQESRPAGADTEAVNEEAEAKNESNEGYVNLQAGIDFTTHYFSRGNLQENQGVIAQPWISGELHLYKDPGNWISDVHILGGMWNSLHDGPTGSRSDASANYTWYESKITVGLSVEVKDVVAISGGYVMTYSPNDRFDAIEEYFARVALADKSLWDLKGDWWEFDGIRLYGLVAWEKFGQRDQGQERGVYAEIGLRPGVTFKGLAFPGLGRWYAPSGWSLKVSLPLTVGFNAGDYYEVAGDGDSAFGFLDLGLDAELPLACINPRYGNWSLYLAGHWIHLGNNSVKFNGGDRNELIGSGGLRFSY